MKRRRFRFRSIAAAMLVLLLASGLLFGAGTLRADAETATISITLSGTTGDGGDNFPAGTEFTFKLYEVGRFSGPDIALDRPYNSYGVDTSVFAKEYDASAHGGAAQEQAIAAEARKLAAHVSGEPAAAIRLKPGDKVDSNLDKALYLMVGSPVIVEPERWVPQTMFVSNLYGDQDFAISNEVAVKMESEKVVFDHGVRKAWGDTFTSAGDELKKALKPEEIKVNIKYGGDVIDTAALNADNDWSYTWTSLETGEEYTYRGTKNGTAFEKKFTPDLTDPQWSVEEVMTSGTNPDAADDPSADDAAKLRYFSDSYDKTANDTSEIFGITNDISTKQIILRKTLDGFDADMQNVTLSFVVLGYDANGEEIWKQHAGISFGPNDDLTKELLITDIPHAVESIDVTEEYSGNYKPDGDPSISYDAAVSTWTVKMNNKHDRPGSGGGVVNRYKLGKDPEQDFGN